jgi:hypothetical protein
MSDYTKLSELVGKTFKVEKVWGYNWKKWDNDAKKMLVSKDWIEGYRKVYEVDTDKGRLDLGTGQIGSLLEAVFQNGKADLNGVTFEVKSNGKTGMDIRYYFNPTKEQKEEVKDESEEVNFEDIPF